MTLVGFEHLTWLRGRVSLLLHDGKCHLVDHDRRVYQTVWPKKKSGETEDDERAIEEEVSVALNTPIVSILFVLQNALY